MPLPLGQGHVKAEGEGVEPPRLIARPLSGRLPSPVGLTFRFPRLRWLDSNQRWGKRHVGLTGRSLLPTRVHRIIAVRTAGVEPAISCARSTRNTRLSYVLLVKSTQRESNPHFRHGKAAGCRYIMGAWLEAELSKNQEHRDHPAGGARTRTLVAALRVRYPRR